LCINHEKITKNEKNTSRSQLRKGDRPWEGRLGESREPMNKNHIRGRHGGASWHNTAKPVGEAVEVNVAVVRRRTAPLPGEICRALRPARAGSAFRGNAGGDRAEPERSGDSLPAKRCRQLSRGHSSANVNRGAGKRPFNRRNPQARAAKGRTNIGEPTRESFQHPNSRPAL